MTLTHGTTGLTASKTIPITYCSSQNALPAAAAYTTAGACGGSNCDGTSEALAYPISSIANLVQLYNDTALNSEHLKYYKLTADLDLACYDWIPIGTTGQPFSGFFYGNSKTISNLYVNDSPSNYQGLFGAADGSTTSSSYLFKDLTLANATIIGGAYVGGLVGRVNGGLIKSIAVSGYVEGNSPVGYIGGVIGQYQVGISSATLPLTYTLDTLVSSGLVHSTTNSSYMGGLVGAMLTGGAGFPSAITSSYSSANITQQTVTGEYGGGLIGSVTGLEQSGTVPITIYNSYATGSINFGDYTGGLVGTMNSGKISGSYATGTVAGSANTGGLVGRLNASGSTPVITSSYATGSVTGGSNVGGLAGQLEGGTVTKSYATGSVSGNVYVGGFFGHGGSSFFPNISESYATGAVVVSITTGGGFGGYMASGGGTTIDNVYSTGVVSGGGASKGDLMGSCWNYSVTDSHALNTIGAWAGAAGNCVSTGTTIETLTDLYLQATFVGWDFSTIWSIVSTVSSPTLQ